MWWNGQPKGRADRPLPPKWMGALSPATPSPILSFPSDFSSPWGHIRLGTAKVTLSSFKKTNQHKPLHTQFFSLLSEKVKMNQPRREHGTWALLDCRSLKVFSSYCDEGNRPHIAPFFSDTFL